MKYYTGIGSRRAPQEILDLMTSIAIHLANEGYILRSGGADGSDKYFEIGANRVDTSLKEICLPKNFPLDGDLYQTAKGLLQPHIVFQLDNTKEYVRKLLSRNMQQLFGKNLDLNNRSEFVICWTPTLDYDDFDAGGTRYACLSARANGIPIYNLLEKEHEDYWRNVIEKKLARP